MHGDTSCLRGPDDREHPEVVSPARTAGLTGGVEWLALFAWCTAMASRWGSGPAGS
jgi:hypothetical protein